VGEHDQHGRNAAQVVGKRDPSTRGRRSVRHVGLLSQKEKLILSSSTEKPANFKAHETFGVKAGSLTTGHALVTGAAPGLEPADVHRRCDALE
jgi:hypothetical protein